MKMLDGLEYLHQIPGHVLKRPPLGVQEYLHGVASKHLDWSSRHQVLQDRNLGGIVILCWVHF
uniref:Uncharacterized protein n=1 Tax=Anguilla anguilla TaxID=7936 RepID=A0A0E9S1B8_ANGAN